MTRRRTFAEIEPDIIAGNRMVAGYKAMPESEFIALREEILAFIPSQEMRDYLREHFLSIHDSDIIDIIVGAHQPMERKAKLMHELAERFPYGNDDSEEERFRDLRDFALYDKQYQDGFADMQIGEDEQAIYLLRSYEFDEEFDSSPHFTFEDALQHLTELVEPWRKDDVPEDLLWFQIEKWINHDGKSIMKSQYILSANECIWDYCYDWDYDEKKHLSSQFGYDNAITMNLPVPFVPGDIVTIDCRPSAMVSHTLILEVGDNMDCCCLQGLCVRENGEVQRGAVKHCSAQDSWRFTPHVSPLYHLERFHGELPPEEAFMTELSEEIIKLQQNHPEDYEDVIWELLDDVNRDTVTPQEIIERVRKVNNEHT